MSSRPEPAPRSPDTRGRILLAAEEAFADHGFAGASLSAVARTVGIGNPGLLHHFASKSALYRAVLDDVGADLDRRDAAVLAADPEPVARLRGLVGVLVAVHRDRPTALMIVAQEFLDRTGRVSRASTLPLSRVVRDTRSVIEAGQARGEVRGGDPLMLTALVHGAVLNTMIGARVYARTADAPDPPWPERDVVEAVVGPLLTAEAHRPGPHPSVS